VFFYTLCFTHLLTIKTNGSKDIWCDVFGFKYCGQFIPHILWGFNTSHQMHLVVSKTSYYLICSSPLISSIPCNLTISCLGLTLVPSMTDHNFLSRRIISILNFQVWWFDPLKLSSTQASNILWLGPWLPPQKEGQDDMKNYSQWFMSMNSLISLNLIQWPFLFTILSSTI
jgi:hypothetical protein